MALFAEIQCGVGNSFTPLEVILMYRKSNAHKCIWSNCALTFVACDTSSNTLETRYSHHRTSVVQTTLPTVHTPSPLFSPPPPPSPSSTKVPSFFSLATRDDKIRPHSLICPKLYFPGSIQRQERTPLPPPLFPSSPLSTKSAQNATLTTSLHPRPPPIHSIRFRSPQVQVKCSRAP